MNDKVNNIRRRLMRDLEDEDKSDLKGQRWNFNINNENLGDAARDQLDKCCFLYEELGKAYALKEGLRRIYRIKDIDLAQNALVYWCELAEASKIREMITMAKTIRKHGAGIIAYWETGITSAAMEGFNNKIGWLTRQAYGYRDEQYLILKIFDLPNLKVTKEL
jgi:transposase